MLDGYTVIFSSFNMERQVNPGEFMNLKLPETDPGKSFWEFTFSGKKNTEYGGLIVPTDVIKYLLAVHSKEGLPELGLIRTILGKLEFKGEKLVIKQDSPFKSLKKTPLLLKERIRLGLEWNTILPLKEARIPALKHLSFTRENPLFRLAFFATALAIFLTLPILSTDAGLSGDDQKHYQHAAKVLRMIPHH